MRINAANLFQDTIESNEEKIISKYEGLLKRCAEVYFTQNGLLLFHCILCENEKLTDVKELCGHLTNEHQNVFTENETDELEENSLQSQEEYNEDDTLIQNEEDLIEIKNDIDREFLSIVEYTITPIEEEEESMDIIVSVENAIETAEQSNNEQQETLKKGRGGRRIKETDGERRFKCTLCSLAFKESYNLRQHLRRHSQAERFKCSQCSKRFHTRTELNTHLRRHTGETPFMCAECGRQFVTSGALTQHMRRHQNLRPCECDICGKRFFDSSQLKHHYIVHTRERTHLCTTCNATFARRKALVTHMKIHANKREYVCHICHTGFNQAPGLRMHLRSKHKDVLSVQEMLKKDKNSL